MTQQLKKKTGVKTHKSARMSAGRLTQSAHTYIATKLTTLTQLFLQLERRPRSRAAMP